jgi:hypothetical protein
VAWCSVAAHRGRNQRLAGTPGSDGRVVGTFVFVVLQQVLKDVAEHLGVVLINGEVILVEELQQSAEVLGGCLEVGGEEVGIAAGPG